MGKDVVSFLSWAAEPEMEERKLVREINLALVIILTVLFMDLSFESQLNFSSFISLIFYLHPVFRWDSNGFSYCHWLSSKLLITVA